MSTAHPTRVEYRSRLARTLRSDVAALLSTLPLCSPFILLVPALTLGAVYVSLWTPWHSLAAKDFQEIVAPSILAMAVLCSIQVLRCRRHLYLHWQVWLTVALFCRELHFAGTNNGIYVALLLLFWYAFRHIERMDPFLRHRAIVTLIGGAISIYAVSKTFDREYWTGLIPALDSFQSHFEESLETTGHLLILALVFVSGGVARSLEGHQQTAPSPAVLRWRWVGVALVPLAAAAVAAVYVRPGDTGTPPIRRAGELPYELSALCLISPEVGDRLFLASSDEHRTLAVWTISESERVRLVCDLELAVPREGGGRYYLDDIEGLTTDGAGTYYAVTSHRQLMPDAERRRAAQSGGTECALVSFQLRRVPQGLEVWNQQILSRDLLKKIRDQRIFPTVSWNHDKVFRWQELTSSWQIDLEGMTWVNGSLLIAFKNPVERGRAAILSYDPATDALGVVGRPDLKGDGILDLAYEAARDRLLVLSNDPGKHSYGDSCLWIGTRSGASEATWHFSKEPTAVLQERSAKRRQKASGLVLHGGQLFVCFDDPLRPVIRKFPLP